MPVTAKICGLSTPETLDAALKGGASHVGFVVFPPSPRHLTLDRLAGLAAQVPAHVRKVGVFVDPDDELLAATVAAGKLDAIQLHKTAPGRGVQGQVTRAGREEDEADMARPVPNRGVERRGGREAADLGGSHGVP